MKVITRQRRTLMTLMVAVAVSGGIWSIRGPESAPAREPAAAAPQERQPAAATAAQARPEPALRQAMLRKLSSANQVLEGLVTSDFDRIREGARGLQKVSAEEQWRYSNDAMYRQHAVRFRQIADRLADAAENKDLDGATLSWVEGTLSCLECHKWVRAMMIAGPPLRQDR